jgi:hypothetical protein
MTARVLSGDWRDIKLTTLSTVVASSDGNQRLLIGMSLYVEPFVDEQPLWRLVKMMKINPDA